VNLEVTDAGNIKDIAEAHRTLMAGSNTPGGNASKYGVIPFKFPAAVGVRNISAISDAILGLRDWDSVMVRKELGILFGRDSVARKSYISDKFNRTLAAAMAALILVEEEER